MDARDLSLLLTLDALLQESNVTRAARRLGLSTPAVSHALARLRERLADDLLVRTGRSMRLTPRGEELRPLVRNLVEDANRVLTTSQPFQPRTLARTFTITATDHALLVFSPIVDGIVRAEAPGVTLRYLPSIVDDWVLLRDGTVDLSVCLPGAFPPEFRLSPLLTERFVCVGRAGHPALARRLTLEAWLALDHVVVAPLGRQSVVDQVLAERGHERRIRLVVPYFAAALHLVAASDDVLTVSASAVEAVRARLPLDVVEAPVALPTYPVSLLWHPRLDNEPANAWLRDVFTRAAAAVREASRRPRRGPRAAR
ncbi:LysR family transcriptional regulator [Luteitalea sp. TBR-22]|uniref:LysR family transcriptional regulator n=1 Tax=Luteitalea sp. TBR-22 TaxID=2802971 RepID=UPI001AFA7A46|nr:LysR family transcriptional regulator [Luteitalea sp. TBR-22]BCS32253.1 LysR family transcriptional regulator [Luteitalea sp. TBR-22]